MTANAPRLCTVNLPSKPNAWEDYLYWQKTDKKVLNQIHKLIKETKRCWILIRRK
nr:type II toxin-antitoxin system YoeB family toxin [Halomonas arcis]